MRSRWLLVALCAVGGACSTFGESAPEPVVVMPEGGTDGATDASNIDGADASSSPESGPSKGCVPGAHSFCEDFDDVSAGIAAYPRWSKTGDLQRTERTTDSASSLPYAWRVFVPSGATDAKTPFLGKDLETPSKTVTCAADIRLVSATAPNLMEVAIYVQSTTAGEGSAVLFFLTGGVRIVGVYRDFSDGGSDYVEDVDTIPTPHLTKPIRTTFRLDLQNTPTATIGWPGVANHSMALTGRLPTSITSVTARFGVKSNDPSLGQLDVRFDDIVCDVE